MRQHPEARTTKGDFVIDQSLAQPARQPTTEKPPRRRGGACGEPSGSISAGSGFPLVRDFGSGLWFHVNCRPGGTPGALAGLLGGAL